MVCGLVDPSFFPLRWIATRQKSKRSRTQVVCGLVTGHFFPVCDVCQVVEGSEVLFDV
jgi:uncharacterized membrane protein YraQ (UPF0718 family)